MTQWDDRHTCKHRQLQSSTETSQAPQPAPELPSWMACESIKERKEASFDGFPGKGMIRKANLLIFSELNLTNFGVLVLLEQETEAQCQQWSPDLRSTSAWASHVFLWSFSVLSLWERTAS